MTQPQDTRPRDDNAVAYCERHPDTETELRCGRCEALICPRCLVHTPGGVRCPDCAQLRRPPMYELSAGHYLRAALVSAALAVAFGLAGAILLPPGPAAGLFTLIIALIAGSAAGSAAAAAITRVTGGKRGMAMQLSAVATFAGAAALRLLLTDSFDGATRDVAGALALIVAVVVAWGRLR